MSVLRVLLLTAVTLIFVMGLTMIFNTSSAEVLDMALKRSTHQALIRQMMYAILGCGVAIILTKAGYRTLLKFSVPIFCICTFMLLLVLIPGIGVQANGSRRWLGIAGYTLQPSEFMKFIAPLFFIHQLSLIKSEIITLKEFLKLVLIIAIPLALIIVEPNNGTVLLIATGMVALCIITRIPTRFWALPMTISLILVGTVAYNVPYVTARIHAYMHPELDLQGKGHQPHQAKIAAGSGLLFGRGPGKSLQKLSYLPEAQNDYIAAIYAEEYGFFGIMILIILYMIIGCVGFHISAQAADVSACYLGSIISFLVCYQAFLNLGVVSGLLPSTGLNLPFFSQGGTSLMVNIAAIGVLLDIEKKSRMTKNPKPQVKMGEQA